MLNVIQAPNISSYFTYLERGLINTLINDSRDSNSCKYLCQLLACNFITLKAFWNSSVHIPSELTGINSAKRKAGDGGWQEELLSCVSGSGRILPFKNAWTMSLMLDNRNYGRQGRSFCTWASVKCISFLSPNFFLSQNRENRKETKNEQTTDQHCVISEAKNALNHELYVMWILLQYREDNVITKLSCLSLCAWHPIFNQLQKI